jgi:prepilin signal peptidase PulO-like enzyme (type II secretory pathway)
VTLRWFDLVPLVSYFAIRGRCRRCGSSISLQYPVVELITGIVFALVYLHQASSIKHQALFLFSPSTGYWLLVWSLLIAISIYDLCHKIIPNGLVYLFSALALAKLLPTMTFTNPQLLVTGYWSLASGFLLAAPLAALWLLSRGRAMGLGDAKLALGIGLLLGLSRGIAALAFSFWLGAAVSLVLLLAQHVGLFLRRGAITIKSEIPFGPFLAAGAFIAGLFEIDVGTIAGWFS